MLTGYAVVEPTAIPDVVVGDLVSVEHIGGGMMRFTFANPIAMVTEDEHVYEVRARLVLSIGSVIRAALWALREAGARCCGCFFMDRGTLH